MNHQEELVFEADDQALAQAAEGEYLAAPRFFEGWVDAAQERGAGETHTLQVLTQDAALEGPAVDLEVG
jgi:hypothetical protein